MQHKVARERELARGRVGRTTQASNSSALCPRDQHPIHPHFTNWGHAAPMGRGPPNCPLVIPCCPPPSRSPCTQPRRFSLGIPHANIFTHSVSRIALPTTLQSPTCGTSRYALLHRDLPSPSLRTVVVIESSGFCHDAFSHSLLESSVLEYGRW